VNVRGEGASMDGRAGRQMSRAVTVVAVIVVGLTFLFGFGDVWILGLRLGVPAYVAPLDLRGFR